MTSEDGDKTKRVSTGIEGLDQHLGGGLIPGTLTVVLGATGIGKTQFGIQFANHGKLSDQREGVIFDFASRGDDQSQASYAQQICNWNLRNYAFTNLDAILDPANLCGQYHRVFAVRATRISRRDLEFDDWHQWQAEINMKLRPAIAFLYENFVKGSKRVVFDGFEPVERSAESVQFNLFEHIYHQVIREDFDWVARELFREKFLETKVKIDANPFDKNQTTCLALCTSNEQMLEDLIARPLSEGDIISNANTLILMGKIKNNQKIARGIHIAKHRGSECSESIIEYGIDDSGIKISN